MMNTSYRPDLKAHLSVDEAEKVRSVRHSQEQWLSDHNNPLLAATDYLQRMAEVFEIPADQLQNLPQKVSFLDPREQKAEYRLSEEKKFFDSTTYGFYETYLNVPVWRAGLSVTVKQNPSRVVHSVNNSQEGIDAKMPDPAAIDRYKRLFRVAETEKASADDRKEERGESKTAPFLREILGLSEQAPTGTRPLRLGRPRVNRGRFFVYRYDEKNRQAHGEDGHSHSGVNEALEIEAHDVHPTLPLPPVPDSIEGGRYYLVAEILFSTATQPWGPLNWRALVEVETNAVLYLRALTDGVNALVFTYDPITSTGVR